MVLDNHNVTNIVTSVKSSSSISDNQSFDTQVDHHTNWKSDLWYRTNNIILMISYVNNKGSSYYIV